MRSLFAVPVFAPGAGDAYSAVVIPTAGDASSAVVIPTATKPQPGLYWVLTHKKTTTAQGVANQTGGFDLLIAREDGSISKIEQPSGKELRVSNETEKVKLIESFKNKGFCETKNESEKTIITNLQSKLLFSGEIDKEKMNKIKAVHNCFGGHNLETCGFTTLVTSLALLGETVVADKTVTIENPGFGSKIELNKLKNIDKDESIDENKEIDFLNRQNVANWLEQNKELLKELSPVLKEQGSETAVIDDTITKSRTKEPRGYNDHLEQGIFSIYDAVKDSTLEKILQAKFELEKEKIKTKSQQEINELKKELENKYSEQSCIKINWENITIEDVAILALLSAFLAVISGPGALAIPVAIAAFRAIAIEKGLNLEGKVDFSTTATPGTSPSGSGAETATKPKVLDASPLAVG